MRIALRTAMFAAPRIFGNDFRRNADGTATVVSLAPVWTPKLARQPDGGVIVSEH